MSGASDAPRPAGSRPSSHPRRRSRASRLSRASPGVATLVAPTAALAAGSPPADEKKTKRPSAYDEGVALVDAGHYAEAREKLESAARQSPRDPDVLNMLAYSQRKSGQIERAIATYKRALELRPRFPQAHEYLAEAYLQACLQELQTLEGYGDEAKGERAQLIRALQSSAADLPPPPAPAAVGGKAGW